MTSSYPGEYGVSVYDPASEEVAEVNGERTFEAASLAKLPVLLTLYREEAAGRLDLDEEIKIHPSDIQPYGTGVLQSYPVGYTMTLRQCARTMIQESDNTAWVMLERRLGKARVSAELASLGADDTDYDALTTTPEDVMLMLRAISDPGYTSPRFSDEMLDAMTDTAYEDRLPEPLPEGVRVAHKVGTVEGTYSDAGVVFRGDEEDYEDYFIVVMSSGTEEGAARRGIRDVSLAVYENLGLTR